MLLFVCLTLLILTIFSAHLWHLLGFYFKNVYMASCSQAANLFIYQEQQLKVESCKLAILRFHLVNEKTKKKHLSSSMVNAMHAYSVTPQVMFILSMTE